MKRPHEFLRSIVTEQTPLELPIRNDRKEQIGVMVPVTRSTADCDEVVEKLAAWRNRARRLFLTQFTAKPATTRKWLKETVLNDPSRLFFLIRTASGKLIGHLGFVNLTERSAELDNLMRGEPGGAPGLIPHAEGTLLQWMFEVLGIEEILGAVFADNPRPIEIHKSFGFREIGEHQVWRVAEGDTIRYVPDDATSAEDEDSRTIKELKLSRSDFLGRPSPVV